MNGEHTCADHEPELSLLLDGRLNGRAAARLRRHLVECPGCLAELEGLRRARSLLRSLPVREVPAGLFTQSALERDPQAPTGEAALLRWAVTPAVGPPSEQVASDAVPTRRWRSVGTLLAVMVMAIGMAMTVGGGGLIRPVDVDLDRLADDHITLTRAGGVPMPIGAWSDVDGAASASAALLTEWGNPASDGATTLLQGAVRGSSVSRTGETLVMTWPNGPDRPAVVSVSPVSVAGQAVAGGVADPTEKYDITVGHVDHIMDRPCIRVDLRLRDQEEVREQVWIDESTGVFLRRVTFDDGRRQRSVSYQSLDLDAAVEPVRSGGETALQQPGQVDALRAGGWDIPASLPGSYQLIGVAVRSDVAGMPVQAVYSDGLYVASLFVQPGQPDLAQISGSAEHVGALTDRMAYLWEGYPNRMLWAAAGRTYTLIGDAPVDDLMGMATGLPAGLVE
ncbi:zf-HC2 domain-containing protein [Euzebya tangerina]|uniref:zf-HC2 domain-containing protein n=1 Tax=Euzebya tangerina TaxID=591198 RepID=UPI000E3248F4|nr:zf-HC2 domain-containing protein [Euzebya tangerina]